jgi:hypothetical protein
LGRHDDSAIALAGCLLEIVADLRVLPIGPILSRDGHLLKVVHENEIRAELINLVQYEPASQVGLEINVKLKRLASLAEFQDPRLFLGRYPASPY